MKTSEMIVTLVFTLSGFSPDLLNAQDINLDLDLIGYYKFDNNFADSSGLDNHATGAGGSFTHNRDGEPMTAYRLRGDGMYVAFPAIIDLTTPPWSYSLWIKPEELASDYSDMFLLSYEGISIWNDVPLFIDNTGNDFKTYYSSDGDKSSTGVVATPGSWYHLGISSAEDDTVKVYVNGERRITRKIDFTSQGDGSILISSTYSQDKLKGRVFGVIDDVRFYGRALNDQEWISLAEVEPVEPIEPIDPLAADTMFLNVQPTLGSPGLIEIISNYNLIAVTVFDINGRKIANKRSIYDSYAFVESYNWASGLYIFRIETIEKEFIEKVMVVN
ncbi:T9SS type A sorting domain-containing protein [Cryomorpha ignava]|uniref:T9SS type A sorting domain-containing protein n=1 Tax=Cryomorpha ignava TaxID=101383 RepID=A0A7K3WRK4_9FLAO|nr:LamG domain-containing protein [Cryomorpha ignava]NEN24309.1 T9SS type A sorting domain-containing protein [Cryomorpha ignava]